MTEQDRSGWKLHALVWLVVLAAITTYAAMKGAWVLTAAPVSLLWPLQVYWSPGISDWGAVTHAVLFQSIQDAGIISACVVYVIILRLMRGSLKEQRVPAVARRRFR